MEGAPQGLPLPLRHLRQSLRSGTNLLFAFRGKPLECLVPGKDALTLGRRLGVEHVQALQNALLLLRAEAIEAGFAAQSLLLLGWAHVLVLAKPLGQMLTSGALCLRTHPALA